MLKRSNSGLSLGIPYLVHLPRCLKASHPIAALVTGWLMFQLFRSSMGVVFKIPCNGSAKQASQQLISLWDKNPGPRLVLSYLLSKLAFGQSLMSAKVNAQQFFAPAHQNAIKREQRRKVEVQTQKYFSWLSNGANIGRESRSSTSTSSLDVDKS